MRHDTYRTAHIYFDNDEAAYAVGDALMLQKIAV